MISIIEIVFIFHIYLGPGTGFAPFRGFIQERWYQKQNGESVGQTILYFGSRNKSEDFIYEEELNQYLSDQTLTKLYTAFSRDQANKVYVTHLLRQNMDEVWDVIGNNNGHIYVCGYSLLINCFIDFYTMVKGLGIVFNLVLLRKEPGYMSVNYYSNFN